MKLTMRNFTLTSYKLFAYVIAGIGLWIILSLRLKAQASGLLVLTMLAMVWASNLTAYRLRQGECSAIFAVVIAGTILLGLPLTIRVVTFGELSIRLLRYLRRRDSSFSYILQKSFQYPLLLVGAGKVTSMAASALGESIWLVQLIIFTLSYFVLNHIIANLHYYLRTNAHWTAAVIWTGIKWDGYVLLISMPLGYGMARSYEHFGSAAWWLLFASILLMMRIVGRYGEMLELNALLRRIYDATGTIADSLGVKQTIETVLDKVGSVVAYDSGAIFFYNPKDEMLEPVSIRGQELALFRNRGLPVSQGISGWVAKTGRWRITGNYSREILAYPLLVHASAINSVLAVPLKVDDEVIGVLTIASYEADYFTEEHARALSIIGTHAAVALRNARRYQETHSLAITDDLTGVYNYAGFVSAYDNTFEEVEKAGRPLSLLMIDIDHFKQINDTYGHLAGNAILKQLGEILKQHLRATDRVCRYGGEEFVVILPGCPEEEAARIGERIRRAVAEHRFTIPLDDRPVQITISLGLAVYPKDGTDPQELIEKADLALYNGAKDMGRNRLGRYAELSELVKCSS